MTTSGLRCAGTEPHLGAEPSPEDKTLDVPQRPVEAAAEQSFRQLELCECILEIWYIQK